MTEVFTRYGGPNGEPRPDDKAPIVCTVRHPEAGGQCEREAIGEVWSLPFCEVHGREAETAFLEERQETIGYGLDMLVTTDFPVLQTPVAAVMEKVERPHLIDHDAVEVAMREAYPPEELAGHIDPDILAYDYEAFSGHTPYDWWCEARYMILRFMREAFDRGALELPKDLETIRERATVQQLLADRDLERRWTALRREAQRTG